MACTLSRQPRAINVVLCCAIGYYDDQVVLLPRRFIEAEVGHRIRHEESVIIGSWLTCALLTVRCQPFRVERFNGAAPTAETIQAAQFRMRPIWKNHLCGIYAARPAEAATKSFVCVSFTSIFNVVWAQRRIENSAISNNVRPSRHLIAHPHQGYIRFRVHLPDTPRSRMLIVASIFDHWPTWNITPSTVPLLKACFLIGTRQGRPYPPAKFRSRRPSHDRRVLRSARLQFVPDESDVLRARSSRHSLLASWRARILLKETPLEQSTPTRKRSPMSPEGQRSLPWPANAH
jgi:hypothetical protein